MTRTLDARDQTHARGGATGHSWSVVARSHASAVAKPSASASSEAFIAMMTSL